MPSLRKCRSLPKPARGLQKPQKEPRGTASLPPIRRAVDPWCERELSQAGCPATRLRIEERKRPFPERTRYERRSTFLGQTTGTSRNRNREHTSSVDLLRPDLRISHCRQRRQSCTSPLWGCTHRSGLLCLAGLDPGNIAGPYFH